MRHLAEIGRTLGARLVLGTLGFCIVFTLLAVGARTWSAWHLHVSAMGNDLALLDQVYQRTLAKAIWEMDRELLTAHVAGAAKVASVGRVELKIMPAAGPPETLQETREGWLPSTLAPSRHLFLVYEPFPGGQETVGELTLYGDERLLWTQLRGEVAAIVLTQLIQSVLLTGLIMWMFNRSVTVHVQRIARHLAQLTPSNLGQPLALNRTHAAQDELSLLVGGVNQLQSSLSDYLEQQRAYELELAGHRDRLAEMVDERTAALKDLNAQLEALSRSDPLTGLPNRRHFDEVKNVEFRRAQRSGRPLSVLLCDVDFFKRFNDRYGHAQGDECLRAVAGAMARDSGRAGNLLARIGGEEFAVLLPAADEAMAMAVAERIRRAVIDLAVPHAGSDVAPVVTLSIGLACFEAGNAEDFGALLHRADLALYLAKSRGRNQVARLDPATD